MQRIVIDTNVLVSSLIQRSYPFLILNFIRQADGIEWCISDEVLAEYTEVLRREKFTRYKEFVANAERILIDIELATVRYFPEIRFSVIGDMSDNKFLELAVTCGADFLISGNTNDFTMNHFGKTEIISPKDYWGKIG